MRGGDCCSTAFPTFSADIFHGLNQRLPRRRMKRTVCTFHDLFVLTGEYSTPEFRQRFAQQARDAAERADLIIAVSAFTAQQVQELLKRGCVALARDPSRSCDA